MSGVTRNAITSAAYTAGSPTTSTPTVTEADDRPGTYGVETRRRLRMMHAGKVK
jgi:hypothetical protein